VETTAGYTAVRPAAQVARTVQVTPDVLVDVDADGRAVGVEVISGALPDAVLIAVLRAARF
jgi:uncharacterized protein YuzE